MASLVFLERCKIFWIEEIRVRIECPQRTRNGALVNRFVGIDLVGEIRFHQLVDARKTLETSFNVVLWTTGGFRGTAHDPRAGDSTKNRAHRDEQWDKEKRLAARQHREEILPD